MDVTWFPLLHDEVLFKAVWDTGILYTYNGANISYVHNHMHVLRSYVHMYMHLYNQEPLCTDTLYLRMYVSLSTVVLNIRDQQGMYGMQHCAYLEAHLTKGLAKKLI